MDVSSESQVWLGSEVVRLREEKAGGKKEDVSLGINQR
jgi:hypothetical protein